MRLVFGSDVVMWLAKVLAGPALVRSIGGVPVGESLQPDQIDTVKSVIDSMFPVRDRAAGVLFDAYESNPAVNGYPLEDIQVPTLLVHARDDTLARFDSAQRAAERIPGARLVALDSGGHLMLGQRKAVRAAVASFLAQETPTTT